MRELDVVQAIARAPMRTMRYADLRQLGVNVWRTADRLISTGALTRLTKGVYTAPPDGRDGRTWRPTLETAGLALATARFGNRRAVLMGLGAARFWTAIPRAIGVTTVAIVEAGRPPVELDRGGTVHLISRDLTKLDTVLERTELGQGLVTMPAQTMYDLMMKPNQGRMPEEAHAAVQNLRAQVTSEDLLEVVERLGRANTRVRELIDQMQDETRHARD